MRLYFVSFLTRTFLVVLIKTFCLWKIEFIQPFELINLPITGENENTAKFDGKMVMFCQNTIIFYFFILVSSFFKISIVRNRYII